MTWLRVAYALGLLGLAGWPLLQPFRGLLHPETWQWTASDLARVVQLAVNTLQLVGSTLLLSLPLGTALALLLFRVRWLPARCLSAAMLLLLFVPLPVVLSCWQALLGHDGMTPAGFWIALDDRPWASGIGPSAWIHAMWSIPWVAAIVGLGLQHSESVLEEEAALQVPVWRVLATVTLVRIRPCLIAASVFVGFVTMNETTVTEMMQVPTLAEEMRMQFTLGEREALARTLLVALPFYLAAWLSLLAGTWYWEKRMPALLLATAPLRRFKLGGRWCWQPLALLAFTLLLLPLCSLAWKVGLRGYPPAWSWAEASGRLTQECRLYGLSIVLSVLLALASGLLVALLALLGSWLARGSSWFRWGLWSVLVFAWILPGPLVGIGLAESIMQFVQGDGFWSALLYRGPSPIPLLWVNVIRFLPMAVFGLWPVVRTMPRELRETLILEGTSEWRLLWPWCRPAFWTIALAVAAMCLGEVAASVRVETPGWESFAKLLFDRMHYGVEASVAALSLLMLGLLVGIGAGAMIVRRRFRVKQ